MRSVSHLAVLGTFASLGGLALSSPPAMACLPDPGRSGFAITGQGAPCQYRFRADGGLDHMTVYVTLRDVFDTPMSGCPMTAGVKLRGASVGGGPCSYPPEPASALCSCCPNSQSGVSDAAGVVTFEFSRLGGRGLADVCATAHCQGVMEIACLEFAFASPDLDGSCDATSATNVIDLGIWAGCLPAVFHCRSADFDCDCDVDVVDLGIFAGGLGTGCAATACP